MTGLPQPRSDELDTVRKLNQLIADDITENGGWISFARYMELALYAPELGYYYNPAVEKFGAAGDFITAPEISSLFARCLAQQVSEILAQTSGAILEIGAGSGAMACDLLIELAQLAGLPERYLIFETSPDLIVRQKRRVEKLPESLARRIEWVNCLPKKIEGVVLANEVLDAMPAHIIHWHQTSVLERGVTVELGKFLWKERALEPGNLFNIAGKYAMSTDYISEINLAARYFVAGIARRIVRGAMLIVDYGFGRNEFYHPQRNRGTMMCHYRHYAHEDPFFLPGLQDITCHVDFSTTFEAAERQGLKLLGYTTQAQFLINCGITKILERLSASTGYTDIAKQAQLLLSPAEMGELFKVIALGRGLSQPLKGFSQGDKRRML